MVPTDLLHESTSSRRWRLLRRAHADDAGRSRLVNNLKLLAGITVGAVAVGFVGTFLPGGAADPAAAVAHPITFPVDPGYVDQVRWTDTYGAPRSGGRTHIGVDLMGDKMIPLVAANDAVLTWGRFDNARGSIVRFRDADGWEYQYIHMNNDTPGTDDGNAECRHVFSAKLCNALTASGGRQSVEVEAGEFIGFLGDSGNAEWTAPHLHFEIYRPTDNGAQPVNPTPFVDEAIQRVGAEPEQPVGPFDGPTAASNEIFERMEGRAPTGDERVRMKGSIESDGLPSALAEMVEDNPSAAMVDRLYLAFFRRPADDQGLDYWVDRRGDGHRLEDVAEWFAESDEFQDRYDQSTFSAFLDQLYRDVLGREPDVDGKDYWLGLLDDGQVTRGTIVVYFSEGAELRRVAQWRSELTTLHRALGHERPTDAEVEAWRVKRQSKDLESSIADLVG